MPNKDTLQFTNTEKALRAAEFSDADIAALAAAEADFGPVVNWPLSQFAEVLDSIRGRAAYAIISEVKAGVAEEANKPVELPEKPPYLRKPEDYDPRNPAQFYTDPDTGEMYRWDGSGRSKTGFRNKIGDLVTRPGKDRLPFGRPHRVAVVAHRRYNGVPLPDEMEARAAISAGYHWFHQGYGVWIGEGGKLTADPSPETRLKVTVALSARESGRVNDPTRPLGRIPARAG